MPELKNLQPKVYEAIVAVVDALSKEGISKSRKNTQQNYSFRGIDDIYSSLSTLLAKHKLCMLPRVVESSQSERISKSGSVLIYSIVKVDFDFVSAEDGSRHTVTTIGEAMDSGDKGSNKAQSAAYKYAALMSFCIPTEGDNDTENTTHEVAPKENPLKLAAKELENRLNNCTTIEQLTSVIAKNNRLLLSLKEKEPEVYDSLSIFITKAQEAFHLSEEAAE